MKKKLLSIGLILSLALGTVGCSTWERNIKSFKSNVSGGLNRKVTAYTMDGKIIGIWEG